MRAPTSTYRLQITEDFDLLEAAKTLRYLKDLGVDWVYLSPVLASETGSDHGYDVSSHASVDPARGRGAGLAALSSEAKRLGMGVLVDIVPNHVGVARPWENPWWWHVLTHGQESQYASAFDIDWAYGNGKVRLPIVGDGDVDAEGRVAELRVLGGELHYRDHRLPLAPGTADAQIAEDANAVLRRQHYTLVNWREADTTLNYRRFFGISTLVAVRVEDPQWFDASHTEIARWFDEGLVDGLRIDHPDGLRDPAGYLDRLAALTKGAYVVVEKILAPGEQLPARWATAGTTGYDAAALVDRLLVDPAGEEPLTALDDELRGWRMDWHQLTHDTKRAVADGMLASETARIARDAEPLLDVPIETEVLVDAVAELLACFPVYRSYLPDGRDHLEAALAEASDRRPDLEVAFTALTPVLTDGASDAAQRFQQTSGMVMAKGVEDCAFYRWGRLTTLTEVGGEPSIFSLTPEQVYAGLAQRQALWPRTMTTRTTHDTKRGEDVRARIAVLSEVPALWATAVRRLQELAPMPDGSFANLLWQAAVGAWPISADRLHAFAEKAMREAGAHTTWTSVDESYESAVHAAVDRLYDDEQVRSVVLDVVSAVVDAGWSNALAATAVSLTMPGVPDVYQGSELWQLCLTDPDNRRPVDFPRLEALLPEAGSAELVGGIDDPGLAKLRLVHGALRLRRDQPELFGSFSPVGADGPAADHVIAFDTGGVITLATRLPLGLHAKGGWRNTTIDLPLGTYRNVHSGALVHADGDPVFVRDVLADPSTSSGNGEEGSGDRHEGPRRAAGHAAAAGREPYRLRRLGTRPRERHPRRTSRRRPRRRTPPADAQGTRRLVDAPGAADGPRVRLRLSHRRRPAGAARPALASAARRRPRLVAHGLPDLPLARPRVDRPAAGRLDRVRAARGHLHPRGHPRRGHRAPRPPRLARRRLRRADAGQRHERRLELGLRRRALVRGPRGLRRPGGVPAVRRRLPRVRARRDPGRRVQPPRRVRELPAALRPVRDRGRRRPGAASSTWSRTTRCAGTSSTTR